MTKEEVITLLCEHFSEGMVRTIIDALKQEQGEPVAYFDLQEGGFYWAKPTKVEAPITVNVEPLPLYTTPQQRCDECGNGGGYALYCLSCAEKFVGNKEWVGLTDNQLVDLVIKHSGFPTKLAEAIEAKLKKKNNTGENN